MIANHKNPMLYQHQKEAVDFALHRNAKCALFMDCGTGKTLTALTIFQKLKTKLLVVAPLSLLNAAWGHDIEKFTSFTYLNLHKKDIPQVWNEDIWLINYEALIGKRFKDIHSMLYKYPVTLIVDESSRAKNHKSKTTKALITLRDHAKHRIVMSATPAPNGLYEYWGQMEFIQRNTLHANFFAFRNTYFHLQRGKQIQTQGSFVSRQTMRELLKTGWKYEITEAKKQALMRRIEPLIFYRKKEDCLDLPDTIDEIREVELSLQQRQIYNDMFKYLITEIKGKAVTAQAALTKLIKLREIVSGFAYDEHGNILEIKHSAKIDELLAVLEEIGKKQVIIWCQFRWEVEKLQALLGEAAVTLYSQTKDKDLSISEFKTGNARYLIAHPQSAGHGLTFTNCSYQVFYSLSYSHELYYQSKARIHRLGQANKCTYIHLIAKNTIDENILSVLKRKGNADEIVYEVLK